MSIDATNFPDANFRAYVKGNFDINNDGLLSQEERASVSFINCSDMGITSLEGVKYFENVDSINCMGNKLTTLDVSGCIALEDLSCNDNKLTTLDVSDCVELEWLYCNNNNLTTLDISGCTNLFRLVW